MKTVTEYRCHHAECGLLATVIDGTWWRRFNNGYDREQAVDPANAYTALSHVDRLNVTVTVNNDAERCEGHDEYVVTYARNYYEDLTAEEPTSMELFVEGAQDFAARGEALLGHQEALADRYNNVHLAAFNAAWGARRYGEYAMYHAWDAAKHDRIVAVLEGAEILPTEVECNDSFGSRSMPGWCSNGTVRVMSDVWENCTGCAGCIRTEGPYTPGIARQSWGNPAERNRFAYELRAAWSFGRFAWLGARVPQITRYATALSAFAVLGTIGQAIAAALSPGLGVSLFITDAITKWNTVTEGGWYRVTGGRGTAAKAKGFEGQLVSLYKNDYGTLRAKLVAADGSTATVASKQISRLPAPKAIAEPDMPKAKRDAVRAEVISRPMYWGRVGRRGETGYVYAGKYAGQTGHVFWQSADRAKLGLKNCGCSGRCDHPVVWCSAHDVAPALHAGMLPDGITRTQADKLGQLLADVGFAAIAEQFRAAMETA